jgi:excinuclease ABC subunit A
VASGTLEELLTHEESITGRCLRQQRCFPSRGVRREVSLPSNPARRKTASEEPGASYLFLKGARRHNLKNISITIPLNRLVLITGVSGSGKSTLVRECFLPAVEAALRRGGRKNIPADIGELSGAEELQAVYEVDQAPIGRTPRSTPATYVGFFDEIRQLFSQVPEARWRGYPAAFPPIVRRTLSRCEGAGTIKLEMNFLPPAFVRCETCGGTRFNRDAGHSVCRTKHRPVLDLSVEALEFFASLPRLHRSLQALFDTGLGYETRPNQPLSGGEAQRVELVTHCWQDFAHASLVPGLQVNIHLGRATIWYICRCHSLVDVLRRLIDAGHSVVVINTTSDLITTSRLVLIDLGPEGGARGGHRRAGSA